jgi:hypothetical protein
MVEQRPFDDFAYCAMDRDWKLVWRPNHPDESELFHLFADAGETENLWAWDHPQAVRLKEALGNHAPWVTEPFPAADDDVGRDSAQALEALGYLGGEGGEPVTGPDWEWVCPVHRAQRAAALTRCPECSRAMILIASGK